MNEYPDAPGSICLSKPEPAAQPGSHTSSAQGMQMGPESAGINFFVRILHLQMLMNAIKKAYLIVECGSALLNFEISYRDPKRFSCSWS